MSVVHRGALLCVGVVLMTRLVGCAAPHHPVADIRPDAITVGATDWVIMDPPQPSPRVTFQDPETGKDVTKAWSQLKNAEILKLIHNTRAEVSVAKFSADGKLTYLVAQATAETGSYQVIMDYMPYKVEDAVDPTTKEKIGSARVGVGLRLTAKLSTTKANIDMGSLLALGVAAKLGHVRGAITVETIGVRLEGSSGLILSSATIDETSIQKTLENIAIIQSKIADSTTTLVPQVLWVKPNSPQFKPADIVIQLRNK